MMFGKKAIPMYVGLILGMAAHAASATVYTTAIGTFDDWGYVGPNGAGWNDFVVPGSGGFNSSRVGQIQHVITQTPDRLTPDAPMDLWKDLIEPTSGQATYFNNANMDGQVNFYGWGYTTKAGSTFSNMRIDTAGNYSIARDDMHFNRYNTFSYQSEAGPNPNPDGEYNTSIRFQPYAISDAKGWCGSVLSSTPGALEKMAGQVTFDFAFDARFPWTGTGPSSPQIVTGFVMRSYGKLTIDLPGILNEDTGLTFDQHFEASAVINNTNPLTGELDSAYSNLVSFMGGGVVPSGAWVSADSFNPDGSRKMRSDYNPTTGLTASVWDVHVVAEGTPGAVWHDNSFKGYGFLLRADGSRDLDFVANPLIDGYNWTDYPVAVPVPAAVWLFGSGLLGLGATFRRRKDGT